MVGVPMVFVRLSGCNLKCEWCDTAHHLGDLMTPEVILNQVLYVTRGRAIKRVCVTGGEPTIHELAPLVYVLHLADYLVHLETNGTHVLDPERDGIFDWITVSPKLQFGVDRWKQRSGDEVKIPIEKDFPMISHLEEVRQLGHFDYWFLQPVDGEDLHPNAKRAFRLACEGQTWRLSGQLHKRLGIM
jgi:organic radical activating enzyme